MPADDALREDLKLARTDLVAALPRALPILYAVHRASIRKRGLRQIAETRERELRRAREPLLESPRATMRPLRSAAIPEACRSARTSWELLAWRASIAFTLAASFSLSTLRFLAWLTWANGNYRGQKVTTTEK